MLKVLINYCQDLRYLSIFHLKEKFEISVLKVCVRKLSDWKVGLPRSFRAHTVSLTIEKGVNIFGSSKKQTIKVYVTVEKLRLHCTKLRVCVRKLSDWNVGLPRSFLTHTASLKLK